MTTSQHCMYTLLHNPICTPTSVFCRRTVAATACSSVNNTESYICANTCLFLTEASSHIQQVVIIFLFYDASARLLSYASLGCLCPEMSAAPGRRHSASSEVLRSLCADINPLIPCLRLVAPFVSTVCLMLL